MKENTFMQLDRYWGTDGAPRARCIRAHALMAHFLESDIQGSLELRHDILQAITQIGTGQLKKWQQTANAHTLGLTATQACIEAEFDKHVRLCRMALQERQEGFQDWLTFLQHGKKTENRLFLSIRSRKYVYRSPKVKIFFAYRMRE